MAAPAPWRHPGEDVEWTPNPPSASTASGTDETLRAALIQHVLAPGAAEAGPSAAGAGAIPTGVSEDFAATDAERPGGNTLSDHGYPRVQFVQAKSTLYSPSHMRLTVNQSICIAFLLVLLLLCGTITLALYVATLSSRLYENQHEMHLMNMSMHNHFHNQQSRISKVESSLAALQTQFDSLNATMVDLAAEVDAMAANSSAASSTPSRLHLPSALKAAADPTGLSVSTALDEQAARLECLATNVSAHAQRLGALAPLLQLQPPQLDSLVRLALEAVDSEAADK